ncbi:hypothetical protein HZS_2157 [Henneguya salminicola]|nr:hypothetical protein HZS_2157 [Henneguya salminicola]
MRYNGSTVGDSILDLFLSQSLYFLTLSMNFFDFLNIRRGLLLSTLDFENGLISAVEHEFTQSTTHLYYLRLKRSIEKKLIKYKISHPFNCNFIVYRVSNLCSSYQN